MKLNIFMDSILPEIETFINRNAQHIDDMNNQLGRMITQDNPQLNKSTEDQSMLPDVSNNVLVPSHRPTTERESSKSSEANNKSETIDKKYYKCPSCGQEANLKTIACDECDEWFHYSCVNLSEDDIKKLPTEFPYICDNCNENHLYSPITSTQMQDTPVEQKDETTNKKLVRTKMSEDSIVASQQLKERHIQDINSEKLQIL